MAAVYAAARARLIDTLMRDTAPGGGWGYFAGKASRLEPTLWALAALAHTPDLPRPFADIAAPHLQYLEHAQQSDGLLRDAPRMPANLASNGLAVVVLSAVAPEKTIVLDRLRAALTGVKGLRVTNEPGAVQNNELQAWPWLPGTFSWVEPTAWCVLALKRSPTSLASAARVSEAEAMLRDRQCTGGGWNYGNASVLGQDLRPYVPTTAAGVLALQDQASTPDAGKALAWLESARLSELSTMALSLAALALHICGRPVDDVLQHVADGVQRTAERGNLHHQAMALCALTLDVHSGLVFRV